MPFIILGLIGVYVVGFVLDVWIVIWNVQAILDHGLSFWPILWLLLVASSIARGATVTTK